MNDPSLEIIVADSSELVRRATTRLLGVSYQVICVSDGVQAFAHMERNPSCTLLTALKMSPMDGRQLLNRIADRWPERLGKVIVMTGWPDPHRWLPGGALVLNKPVTPEVLRAVVEARVALPSAANDGQRA